MKLIHVTKVPHQPNPPPKQAMKMQPYKQLIGALNNPLQQLTQSNYKTIHKSAGTQLSNVPNQGTHHNS